MMVLWWYSDGDDSDAFDLVIVMIVVVVMKILMVIWCNQVSDDDGYDFDRSKW